MTGSRNKTVFCVPCSVFSESEKKGVFEFSSLAGQLNPEFEGEQNTENRTRKTNPILFVTGTDTGVGKTYVCGALLKYLRGQGIDAGYQKWVSTGSDGLPADLAACLEAAGIPAAEALPELQVPYRFRLGASPHLAAEAEGRRIDPEIMLARCRELAGRHRFLIVEGVGGVLVPLRRDLLLADFLTRLQLPTLLVARSGLGTLNHTLLSLEALRARKVPVLGVVCSDGAAEEDERIVRDNLRTIAEMGQIRVFGRLRRDAGEEAEPIWKAIVGGLEDLSFKI